MTSASKKLERATLIDDRFSAAVQAHQPAPPATTLADAGIETEAFLEVFESQLLSRHLDLLARRLRLENRVFSTIEAAPS